LFAAANCNDPRKGYADFERLVSQLQVHAVVVGEPPKQRSPVINYVGLISTPERLAAYYAAADLLVMTTQADNYPNVIIEAMACGTAVLAYNVGGIPDQMPGFWDGLVPVNDFAALLERCRAILADVSRLHDLSAAFREHALNNWQPEMVARQYISAYQTVMQY
jgi:glycosyltransferase involved in cell wall biosynthesis